VACIYVNWQSLFEDPPDTLNAQRHNGRSPTNSNQEPEYSSEAAGWEVANKPRGAERSTPAGYSSHLPLNNIPAPRAGITTFSVQMVTSGVANQF